LALSEIINNMIDKAIKSVVIISPRFTDYRVDEILVKENPDLEAEIEKLLQSKEENTPFTNKDKEGLDQKTKKKIDDTSEKVKEWGKGNIGDIQKLSTEQFGNIRSLATDPFSFMSRTILRKLKTGAGVLFIVTIAVEVAKFLIQELFKPGRIFDIRFREQIDLQIIKFLERKEQEELRRGFKNVITTTIGGLRGDSLRGNIGGNFYTPDRIPPRFIDESRLSPHNFNAQDNRKKSFQKCRS